MIPVPAIIAALGLGAWYASSKRNGSVSPQVAAERKVIYDTAINQIKDVDKLRTLSIAFREAGMTAEADMLQKRIALAEAPPNVKAERKEAYRKGMASKDPSAVRNLATAFDEMGATGAAASLRQYADGLVAAAVPVTTEGVT